MKNQRLTVVLLICMFSFIIPSVVLARYGNACSSAYSAISDISDSMDAELRSEKLAQLQDYLQVHIAESDSVTEVVRLHLLLARVCVKDDRLEEAQQVVVNALRAFRRDGNPAEFQGWLNTQACSKDNVRGWRKNQNTMILNAAKSLHLDLPNQSRCNAMDQDFDLDGKVRLDDECFGFDDRRDSDGDGVPDGCDFCPGHDDALDKDQDGHSHEFQIRGIVSLRTCWHILYLKL